MKKIKLLLLTALVAGSAISTFAAGDDDDKSKGIRAGWQTSNFYDANGDADNAISSFYVGFFNEQSIVPLLKFGSGVEYSSSGTSADLLGIEAKYVRHAISIPLYLKVKLGPVFALGGAAANFGVANKFTLGGENIDLEDNQKTKVFNVPVFAGLGVKILMFSIEARYHWGLSNLSKADNTTLKNQYFQLGAAISF